MKVVVGLRYLLGMRPSLVFLDLEWSVSLLIYIERRKKPRASGRIRVRDPWLHVCFFRRLLEHGVVVLFCHGAAWFHRTGTGIVLKVKCSGTWLEDDYSKSLSLSLSLTHALTLRAVIHMNWERGRWPNLMFLLVENGKRGNAWTKQGLGCLLANMMCRHVLRVWSWWWWWNSLSHSRCLPLNDLGLEVINRCALWSWLEGCSQIWSHRPLKLIKVVWLERCLMNNTLKMNSKLFI